MTDCQSASQSWYQAPCMAQDKIFVTVKHLRYFQHGASSLTIECVSFVTVMEASRCHLHSHFTSWVLWWPLLYSSDSAPLSSAMICTNTIATPRRTVHIRSLNSWTPWCCREVGHSFPHCCCCCCVLLHSTAEMLRSGVLPDIVLGTLRDFPFLHFITCMAATSILGGMRFLSIQQIAAAKCWYCLVQVTGPTTHTVAACS